MKIMKIGMRVDMKNGFTLVELAVVMIVIGLLIGGIIGGAALRRDSQIQAVISDLGKYKQNANMFKEKYYYWPGDQPDATNYWAAVSVGNGNGQIGGVNTASSHPAAGTCNTAGNICSAGESFYANRALYEAGYLTKPYTTSGTITPDVNFPKAPLSKISVMTLSAPIYVYTYTTLSSLNRNVVSITDIVTTSYQSGAVAPNIAFAIDRKIDDGLAASGDLRGLDNASASSTCLSSGVYDTSNSSTSKCIVSLFLD